MGGYAPHTPQRIRDARDSEFPENQSLGKMGEHRTHHHTKTDAVVPVAREVPETTGAPHVPIITEERTPAQHTEVFLIVQIFAAIL